MFWHFADSIFLFSFWFIGFSELSLSLHDDLSLFAICLYFSCLVYLSVSVRVCVCLNLAIIYNYCWCFSLGLSISSSVPLPEWVLTGILRMIVNRLAKEKKKNVSLYTVWEVKCNMILRTYACCLSMNERFADGNFTYLLLIWSWPIDLLLVSKLSQFFSHFICPFLSPSHQCHSFVLRSSMFLVSSSIYYSVSSFLFFNFEVLNVIRELFWDIPRDDLNYKLYVLMCRKSCCHQIWFWSHIWFLQWR